MVTFLLQVLDELEIAHPGLRALATQLDVRLLGHAMTRPTPGLVHGVARATASGERRRETHVAHETARVSERSSRWPTDAAGQIMYAHAPGISQRQPAPTSSLRCTEAWPPWPPSIAIAARTHPRLGWKRHPV